MCSITQESKIFHWSSVILDWRISGVKFQDCGGATKGFPRLPTCSEESHRTALLNLLLIGSVSTEVLNCRYQAIALKFPGS